MITITRIVALAAAAAVALAPRGAGATETNQLNARLVFSPKITYPDAKTTWTAGKEAFVLWETSEIPESLKDVTGVIRLGHIEDGSESLNLADTLAKDFALSLGNVSITVPKVLETRNDYIVVLFGDSGNHSPKFTIKA
ncbi:hypothetical protein MCUN1_001066 [Malassezia cuniculi]|uniref:Uncharacterized protein n=1 Tax=Malassezia cuniculi TaxID=948313 RepID=A0AAF0J678_9BASI|nr:hypothetical protein MCUN1_001066 [Malassezia cuniculi]